MNPKLKAALISILFVPIMASSGAKDRSKGTMVKIPKALILKHSGDEYGGDNIFEGVGGPKGNEPDNYPHAGDYTGTYILEGTFNGAPYWVQNRCIGEYEIGECRCYIYLWKNKTTWVLVPQPPGTVLSGGEDWHANAHITAKWPWDGPWKGEVTSVIINNDIDLVKAQKEARLNSCPIDEKVNPSNEQQEKQANTSQAKLTNNPVPILNRQSENSVDENSKSYGYSTNKEERKITNESERNSIEGELIQEDQTPNQEMLPVIKIQNGGVFIGEVKDGKPHGIGMISFKEKGMVHIGEWKIGSPDGLGVKYEMKTNDFYIGEFKNGQKNGLGKTYNIKSSILDVIEFMINSELKTKEDLENFLSDINRYATTSYTDLIKSSGTFKDNIMHGQGTLHYEDTSRYSGNFVQGIPNGQGKMNFANGDFYQGNFKDGIPSGKGVLSSRDGSKYSGEFKKGVANGRGTFADKSGNKYTGFWKDGKLMQQK